MPAKKYNKILVLGAGHFGTCLAQHLALLGNNVTMWTRSPEIANAINQTHKNPKYLSTINLSPRVSATNKIDKLLMQEHQAVLQTVPTQSMREVLSNIASYWHNDLLMICAAKGLEIATHQLPSDIIKSVLGEEVANQAVYLSGPSFALEVADQLPTAVVAASLDAKCATQVQELFHASHLRVYTSDDPIGLEIAGALKNVVAIAAGASAGLGYQMNSRAALITRGLAEISRIGVRLGANHLTFMGLAGVGDLFLTCTSEKSRNYTVGFRLGRGERLRDVVDTVGSVAEGVSTAKAAYQLTQSLKIESPIIHEVYSVLYEDKPIVQAVTDLINREAKPEFSF